MEEGVKHMLTMMEQDSASLANKAQMCKDTRPDLVAKVEDFYSMYQSLAERYHHLTSQLYDNLPADAESGYIADSPLLTPFQKLPSHKPAHPVESVCSGAATSSDLSLREGSESFSSSDSESESFNSSGNAYFSLPMNSDRMSLRHKILDLGVEIPSMEQKLQMVDAQENGNNEDLLRRITGLSEELRVSSEKLQLSEDEVVRLKGELEKSESLVETLRAQLESTGRDCKMREGDFEMERIRVLELQKQLTESENEFQGQLRFAEEQLTMLKFKLDSESNQALHLQERIVLYKNNLCDRENEVSDLKAALLDAQENYSTETAHLLSDIFSLTEKRDILEASLRESELKIRTLEEKFWQCEATKMELIGLHDAKEIELEKQISNLKVELLDKGGHVEVLNKRLDSMKFKYDMVMAEKDGMTAKINTLMADMSSRDDRIRQMDEHLRQLRMEHAELVAGSEDSQKLVDELRSRVRELEREVDRQRVEIFAGAEEKREAIRQLCFSLDHYRSGYKELRQAFLGHKRHAVMAS